MDAQFVKRLSGKALEKWTSLLTQNGLHCDVPPEYTLLLYDGDQLAAAGSRDGNVLKYIAVDPAYQQKDLASSVLTQLRQNAFFHDISQLFLYTKPANRLIFSSLMFYPVAETGDVLLMESESNGIGDFLTALPRIDISGKIGAVVMNGNPFTRGHRFLAEQAARECDAVYVFVLSEDRSLFPFPDRFSMARAGLADLKNVLVVPSGPYLISSATFPTYFLKKTTDASRAQCELDAEVFLCHYVPALHITDRFVGTEPLCEVTSAYNRVLRSRLAGRGVSFHEVSRVEANSAPISASAVRDALGAHDISRLTGLLPESTLQYLRAQKYI